MYGHFPAFGIVLSIAHAAVAGGFLYLMYQISKSLKRIANHLDNK
jgi:hypothetical protein